MDPAAFALQLAKRKRAAGGAAVAKKGGKKDGGDDKFKSTRSHADAVNVALMAWEKLRVERTPPEERLRHIDAVLSAFEGTIVQVS